MRLKSLFLALCTMLSCSLFGLSAADAGFHHRRAPAGWGEVRTVRHWVYRPRYHHEYHYDRYAYWYRQPRYYPGYNTGYWRPAREMCCGYRARFAIPAYQLSWGIGPRLARRHYRRW